jgi:serine/threonine-protein kinase
VGTLVGTPAYLAPERGAGEPATAASDLYSLGIVAYECLTGSTPFHGTALEVAAANRYGSLPPLPAGVPAPVTALVTDLTAKDPAARPGSAAEVAARAAQLRDAMNGGRNVPAGRPAALPSAAIPLPTAVLPDPRAPATEMLDWPAAAPPGRAAVGRRAGRTRAGWIAGLAIVLVALAGWLLASAVRQPAPPQAAPPPASPAVRTQGPPTVNVNATALVGRPVDAVRQQLADRGLRPRVIRSVTGGQRPGTVVSVQPAGRVAEGSVITVTAAVVPPGHRHHHGHGHQDGQGGGHGGD